MSKWTIAFIINFHDPTSPLGVVVLRSVVASIVHQLSVVYVHKPDTIPSLPHSSLTY